MVFFLGVSSAQEIETQQDTTVVKTAPLLDSTYFKKDIFSILQESGPAANKINIEQTNAMKDALNSHIAASSGRKISGYRVRIFFDNKQEARSYSLAAKSSFASSHPDIPSYWNYDNPYFKVTVGDFRTKSEAMILIQQIKDEFPSAFLVKQTINFPPL